MAEYINRKRARFEAKRYFKNMDEIKEDLDMLFCMLPAEDVAPVRHGRWEDGRCSNCKEESVSTSFDEQIYNYDWEEDLRYSHTETHTEYHLTNYCPNCGAKMDLEG